MDRLYIDPVIQIQKAKVSNNRTIKYKSRVQQISEDAEFQSNM
jgi:hypothetical protein